MDLSISDACKRLGKKSLSGEALENTTLRNWHVSRAKMFWTVILYQGILEWIGYIFTKYEHSTSKNKFVPVFSKWRGDNWSWISSKRASDPDHFTAAADGVGVERNSWKFDRMCMKGLTFLMWNLIIIYLLVLKMYRENLKISTITGRLQVCKWNLYLATSCLIWP